MIYFLKARSHDLCKIGYTSRSNLRRVAEVTAGLPIETDLIGTIEGDVSVERALHRRFDSVRQRPNGRRTEWFVYSAIENQLADIIGGAVRIDPNERFVCQGCGVFRNGDVRDPLCRRCAGKKRAAQRPPRVPKPTKVDICVPCQGCGTALKNQQALKAGRHTGLCRPCGMKRAWASDEYRASIMPSREKRRRNCPVCHYAYPLLRKDSKHHPECWDAISKPRDTLVTPMRITPMPPIQ